MAELKKMAELYQKQPGAAGGIPSGLGTVQEEEEDDDDIPDLVENFEEASEKK